MGHALCLQSWRNITGLAGQTIIQHDSEWADLAGYQDVAVYLEVSQISDQNTATTTLSIQTAPERNEAMFVAYPATTYPFTGTPIVGVQTVHVVRGDSLHRFVRWSLTVGGIATSMHFRIWLNLNQAGW